MPTVTKTIGTEAGRDYSTITAWKDDINNTTYPDADTHAIGDCYDDSPFDETVTIKPSASNVTALTLTVAEGERHDGTAGTGARVVRTAYASILQLDPPGNMNMAASWLELDNNNEDAGGSSQRGLWIGGSADAVTGDEIRASQLLVHSQKGNFWHYGILLTQIGPAGTDIYVHNTIIYNITKSFGTGASDAWGVHRELAVASVEVYNITIHNTRGFGDGLASGFRGDGNADASIKNLLITDTAHDGGGSGDAADFQETSTGTLETSHNASSDATAIGTDTLINLDSDNQYVSTVVGSEDLRLKSGADVIDAGTDLSSTSVADIEIAITGVTRPQGAAWDIGADEFEGEPPDDIPVGSGRIAAVGTLSGEGQVERAGAGLITAIGSLAGEGRVAREGSGSITAIGTLAGQGQVDRTGAGAITAVATLSGQGIAPIIGVAEGSGSITAVATLSGQGHTDRTGSGSITAIGTLSGQGIAPGIGVPVGSGRISAIGTLSGQGHVDRTGSGAVTAIGTLAGEGQTGRTGSGSITAIGTLSGEGIAPGVGIAEGSGRIAAIATLRGEGHVTLTGAGAITAVGRLSGHGIAARTGTGRITAIATLRGQGIGEPSVFRPSQVIVLPPH